LCCKNFPDPKQTAPGHEQQRGFSGQFKSSDKVVKKIRIANGIAGGENEVHQQPKQRPGSRRQQVASAGPGALH